MDDDEDLFGGDVADEDLMLAYETTQSSRLSTSSRPMAAVTTPSTVSTARTTPRTSISSRSIAPNAGRPVVSTFRPHAAGVTMAAPPRPQPIDSNLSRGGPQIQNNNFRQSTAQAPIDLSAELDDLPSDAFDSSFASYTGAASHSQRSIISSARNPLRLSGQQSFRQTTLYGDTLQAEASQAVHHNHAFVSDMPAEKPTHHKIDKEAMKTWVYPTNLGAIRDYQFSIVKNSLFNNTLVALPTGLGKTFIAATVILNFYRWTTDAKIIFVAPTKPLVSQQVDACLNIAGIPRSDTTLLTGETPPALREAEWASKRLFFMTPQTLQNDLSKGYADPKSIALLVIDEAHRATGDYAYVKVIGFMRRFTNSFRVLALTATPGSSVEAVQEVIDNLGMSNVEIRTEDSIDIRQYVHNRDIERLTMEPSTEMKCVQDLFSKALKPFCDRLTQQGIWFGRDPMSLNTFTLLRAQREWAAGPARHLNQGTKFMIMATFALLKTLAHSIKLLNFHGIRACYDNLAELRAETEKDEKGSKNRKAFFRDPDFQEMMMTIERWMKEDGFESHPKLTFLKEQLFDHFKDQPPGSNTRAIVFNEFRDSAEDIVRNLNRGIPNVKASIFVGQADSKRSAGMKQKDQIEAIKRFKSGEFNVLVATSIGEEGLDIGQVDLIICYDASSSPIRMLQRMGRTGRKRAGRVLLLLMKGKEEDKFAEAQDKYSNMQKLVSEGSRFNFRFDLSERIVPRDIKPEVDKRHVEIPIENTQDMSLPEPRKARGKLPKASKKVFHMPDDAETGFVTASTVREDGQTKLGFKVRQKAAAPRPAVPEVAETDFLVDIPDPGTDLRGANKSGGFNSNSSFASAFGPQDNIPVIDTSDPKPLQKLRPTKYLHHGAFTRRNVRLMGRLVEGSYDRPRSYGQSYMRHRVPKFAPNSDESGESEEERVFGHPPPAKSRTQAQAQPKPTASATTLPLSMEPLAKRRRVGPVSAMTERARLTPAGYINNQPAIKEYGYDEEDEDDGASQWPKKKSSRSSFKPAMKGMTRQRSSQNQSYSFGGGDGRGGGQGDASVKNESSEDDFPTSNRRMFTSKRAGERRVPATRAPLPMYGHATPAPAPPVKPTVQRILEDFPDGSDDSDPEPNRVAAKVDPVPSNSTRKRRSFDILDQLDEELDDKELDDDLGGDSDLGMVMDMAMPDVVQETGEADRKQELEKEMESEIGNMMEDIGDAAFDEDIQAMSTFPEIPQAATAKSAPLQRTTPGSQGESRIFAETEEPGLPKAPSNHEFSDIPDMSDMSDLLEEPALPNFSKPLEPLPREPFPDDEPISWEPTPPPPCREPTPEAVLSWEPTLQPQRPEPVYQREPPRQPSPHGLTSLTPSPESDKDKYIIRFSQPAGTGASLRGIRRGRGRGRGARVVRARGGARGGGGGGGGGFAAITEEADAAEEEEVDYFGGGRGRGRGRGRARGGRGSRGGAVSYGRLEERGDDCMRTSDNYETDGSDSGGDLVDFIVDDNDEVEVAPTSSLQEPLHAITDDDSDDGDDGFEPRRRSRATGGGRRLVSKSRRSAVVFTSSPMASSPPPVTAARKKTDATRRTTNKTKSKANANGSVEMPIHLSQTRGDSDDDDDDDDDGVFSERHGRANQQAPAATTKMKPQKKTATAKSKAAPKKRAPAKMTGPPPKSAEFILSGEDDSSDVVRDDDDGLDGGDKAVMRRPAGFRRGRRLVFDSDSE
ncbi:dead box helicase [Sporothrix brasiliensis 5110]|uniref:ATP-dependent DNA helicase MPH1 n=1 Tax=Sporothrix brasiliensis 5110 TaxID=1398154 RepID=A0A0C2ICE2_9PEZI|nr:dead box helicase [Sporothrix brasiliensis 5110]KIH86976.1 dead box helicase [Sporothrix brasiliensis 5110]